MNDAFILHLKGIMNDSAIFNMLNSSRNIGKGRFDVEGESSEAEDAVSREDIFRGDG